MSNEDHKTESASRRVSRAARTLVGLALAVVAVVTVAGLGTMATVNKFRGPADMVFLHYTGEFRYQTASSPSWCAVETVKLKKSVLDRVMGTTPVPAGDAGGGVSTPTELQASRR